MVILRKSVAGATEQSLSRFVTSARRAANLRGRVTVLITTSRELRSLNRQFRSKDKATDVLSFPAMQPQTLKGRAGSGQLPDTADEIEGDIAISADIACRNAAALGHPPVDELKILILHGILHLAGHDHETDDGEMARTESLLRRRFRLPDSLIERTLTGGSRPQLAAPLPSRRVAAKCGAAGVRPSRTVSKKRISAATTGGTGSGRGKVSTRSAKTTGVRKGGRRS